MLRFDQAVLSLSLVAVVILSGCGGGGGGGAQVPARVPAGSGVLTINMAGRWVLTNPRVVESTAPAQPPVVGTVVSMASDQVLAINSTSTSRAAVESSLGFALEWYVNSVDGRTFLLGWRGRNPQTGDVVEIGVAGGAIANDSIAVESYLGIQPQSGSYAFVRSRYELVRTGSFGLDWSEETPESQRAAFLRIAGTIAEKTSR